MTEMTRVTTTNVADVRAFMVKFGILVADTPGLTEPVLLEDRFDLMQEELTEFKNAMRALDLPKMADALVDLVYVTLGTAVQLGLPWQALWDDVQRANMTKVPGMTHRGQAHDVTKPPGWAGPRTDEILREAGWTGPATEFRNYPSAKPRGKIIRHNAEPHEPNEHPDRLYVYAADMLGRTWGGGRWLQVAPKAVPVPAAWGIAKHFTDDDLQKKEVLAAFGACFYEIRRQLGAGYDVVVPVHGFVKHLASEEIRLFLEQVLAELETKYGVVQP